MAAVPVPHGDPSMPPASARRRMLAPLIAVGVLLAGCGPSPQSQPNSSPASPSGQAASAGSAQRVASELVPLNVPVGGLFKNHVSKRSEVVLADVDHTAVLIGDSQAMPKDSWPQRGIAALGYKLYVAGMGGTGYVAGNGKTANYIDALQRGDWVLPYGEPPLVVVEGGGNDATQHATDGQITANAERLLAALKQRYPDAALAMIGTLARGAGNGGGRRTEVDALIGRIAANHGIPFVSTGDWLTRYNAVGDLIDGVHVKPSGHAKLGSALAKQLLALGLAARPGGTGKTPK
ncbi:SGNH/GDSL hydrolase family protein [Arthrobacter sp. SIMBA_036]|uniref:SGNH/GDSL hydrolase family protein n=1 Tax=Arthrobacter sp. SIMBA_036 TaxID=3085778 RepID=UPI003978CACC